MIGRERRMARLASYRPWWYWGGTVGWIVWFVLPLLPGWLLGQLFDELQRVGASSRFWGLLTALLAAEVGSALVLYAAHRIYVPGVEAAKNVVRANALHAQLASGGEDAAPRNVAVGDVLVRLRDDPFDVLFLLDNWVDLCGSLLYASGAVFLLVRIDPWAAVAGVVPMLAVGWGNSLVGHAARRYRQRSRTASSQVNDFLTSVFDAALTVRVAGAQPDILRRLDRHNRERSRSMVGDQVWNDLVWTLNSTLADVFVGLALVVAARGALSAGEVTQFAHYLLTLVWLPMRLGGIVVGRRRYDVSARRLDALVAPLPSTSASPASDRLVEHRALPVLGGAPAPGPQMPARRPLRCLEVDGLTVVARGLDAISFRAERGELVIVTGPVGSGKSSLLRAVVGLLPMDSGIVRWNGEEAGDRAAFFVPPQCAYVAQVPRLLSESLADNLRLGYPLPDGDLFAAIALAAFDRDVEELPEGLATMIGARGVRLSGGQAQRAAAARALVHAPELLVLDDLTSALDVETEHLLWERLAAAGMTVLAASNRPVALARASRVIDLA